MSEERELAALSSPEARRLLPDSVAVIPVGAVEQHGPHLPLDTDAYLATEVSAAAVRGSSAQAILCPTLHVGVSAHHLDFSGTLSLWPDTLLRTVTDISSSLAFHGCTHQLLVNGHSGNTALLQQAVQQIGLQTPVRIATLNYWHLALPALSEHRRSEPGGMAHAGEFETALMLHLRPETVRSNLIAAHVPPPRLSGERFDLFQPGFVHLDWRSSELSETGVMGRPDLATAHNGHIWFNACVAGLVGTIDKLATLPPKPDKTAYQARGPQMGHD